MFFMHAAWSGKFRCVDGFADVMGGSAKQNQVPIEDKLWKACRKLTGKFGGNIMNQRQVGHKPRRCLH